MHKLSQKSDMSPSPKLNLFFQTLRIHRCIVMSISRTRARSCIKLHRTQLKLRPGNFYCQTFPREGTLRKNLFALFRIVLLVENQIIFKSVDDGRNFCLLETSYLLTLVDRQRGIRVKKPSKDRYYSVVWFSRQVRIRKGQYIS